LLQYQHKQQQQQQQQVYDEGSLTDATGPITLPTDRVNALEGASNTSEDTDDSGFDGLLGHTDSESSSIMNKNSDVPKRRGSTQRRIRKQQDDEDQSRGKEDCTCDGLNALGILFGFPA
jgi:hypothetical protein